MSSLFDATSWSALKIKNKSDILKFENYFGF